MDWTHTPRLDLCAFCVAYETGQVSSKPTCARIADASLRILQDKAELNAITSNDDISRLIGSKMDKTWQDTVRKQAKAPEGQPIRLNRITPSLIVKCHDGWEAASLEFVRQHMTIPVPRIHHPHLDQLVMDFVDGDMLRECWPKLSKLMQFRIACTLRLYVRQMRSFRRANVGAVDTGGIGGVLFEFLEFAPPQDLEHFRRFCEWVASAGWESCVGMPPYRGNVLPNPPCADFDWTPVFTHGDLNSTNILLDKDGCLWLVDWATAGFYPACMESLSMRVVEECVPPPPGLESWCRYRDFICGRVSKQEREFWEYFHGAIHRCQYLAVRDM